jgi:endonuclease/exonuclease/phosphatase family metal-dependent hydrolase
MTRLTVMSFNLRYDKPDPDEFNWRVRRGAIASMINYYNPHLIGTQEAKAHQLLDLHRMLPQYQSVGRDRAGKGTDEHCAIFYHTQRLECANTGDLFLSETPDVPGSITHTWGNPLPRMATWGLFRFTENLATQVALCNTHLDYNSAKARQRSAKLITQTIPKLAPQQAYRFLTADFNAAPNTPSRQTFATLLKDALQDLPLPEQMTYNDFTDAACEPIDTIYYDPRVQLEWAKVDQNRWEGILPSDHFPVIAEFNLLESA